MSDNWTACSHCGGEIKASATFCRHCGSSDSDGWSDGEEGYETDDDFDYEGFVEDNFGESDANVRTPVHWRTVAVILLVLAAFAYLSVFQ